MTSTAAITPTVGKGTLESQIHKLKLDWVMAKDESERKRVSAEIRRLSGVQQRR